MKIQYRYVHFVYIYSGSWAVLTFSYSFYNILYESLFSTNLNAEAVASRCSLKQVFLNIHKKIPILGPLLNKVAGLKLFLQNTSGGCFCKWSLISVSIKSKISFNRQSFLVTINLYGSFDVMHGQAPKILSFLKGTLMQI